MLKILCNIDKSDRINRTVIGSLLFVAAFIGMSQAFYMILGLILILEGLVGWCSIPYLMNKFRKQ